MDSTSFKQPKLESSEAFPSVFVRNHREIKEKKKEAADRILKIVNAAWHKGRWSGNEQEYRYEVSILERTISTLTTDIIVLHTSYYEICGRIMDCATWGENEDTYPGLVAS
ncbi:unnamed protein product [Clonostachys rosea f. rosea IK726]|jgi:hypothetical protein|uniref:Uncharacterized protein n=1 Tax=Clonostachys rosea f. rosea IK726 TaxID=1349383 RepID=A0ACA9TFM1_BIOOC|nr:unnamed protein product [Clonostachys rosea f. rosea IK726]